MPLAIGWRPAAWLLDCWPRRQLIQRWSCVTRHTKFKAWFGDSWTPVVVTINLGQQATTSLPQITETLPSSCILLVVLAIFNPFTCNTGSGHGNNGWVGSVGPNYCGWSNFEWTWYSGKAVSHPAIRKAMVLLSVASALDGYLEHLRTTVPEREKRYPRYKIRLYIYTPLWDSLGIPKICKVLSQNAHGFIGFGLLIAQSRGGSNACLRCNQWRLGSRSRLVKRWWACGEYTVYNSIYSTCMLLLCHVLYITSFVYID